MATDWDRELAGTEAGRAMAAFLLEFGHRALDKLEIALPRWVEAPSYVVETVRQHIESGLDAPPEQHAAAARRAAERELRAALRFHPMRPVVLWMLDRARRASALRENTKSVLVLSMLPLRRMANELALRLVQRGFLDTPADAFFLTMWENTALQKGEILVAPATDPGWTPLFLRAAGLVMETGGFLSHGAIVAREYGIPAVANLPGIRDTLQDGDSLLVDGNSGRLTRSRSAENRT